MAEPSTPGSRAIRFAAAAFIINIVAVLFLLGIALQNRANGRYIRDCTTAGPHKPTAADPTTGHACYDEGQKRTRQAITDLRRSIDCVGFYFHPPADPAWRVSCDGAIGRLNSIAAGIDPFAPPTTVPKGTR